MPTRNINLTAKQDAFVEDIIRSGKYQNASEALRDALRGLEYRIKAEDLKLELLRKELKIGMDAFDTGEFIEIDDENLDTALDGFTHQLAN